MGPTQSTHHRVVLMFYLRVHLFLSLLLSLLLQHQNLLALLPQPDAFIVGGAGYGHTARARRQPPHLAVVPRAKRRHVVKRVGIPLLHRAVLTAGEEQMRLWQERYAHYTAKAQIVCNILASVQFKIKISTMSFTALSSNRHFDRSIYMRKELTNHNGERTDQSP